MALPDRVCLGAISGARGVRGEVKIKTFTDDPISIAAYGPLESEDGSRRFELREVKLAGDQVLAFVEGVTDREQALALKGMRLYVSRAALPEPEADEFYHADLVGLRAQDENGPLGTVIAVHDFGAGELLEIELEGSGQSVMVPFTREAAPEIDLESGTIVINPPGGLLDDGAKGEDEEKRKT